MAKSTPSQPNSYEVAESSDTVVDNPWQSLRDFTSARIALGRCGNSIPTKQLLAFQLDHAQAMDAVHCPLDDGKLLDALLQDPVIANATLSEPLVVESRVTDRLMYLQRPDLGRQLNEASWQQLTQVAAQYRRSPDLAIVIADGLSSVAIADHALPFLQRLIQTLTTDQTTPWQLAPITIVKQGRVAVGDDVAECLKAKMVLVLIGERPGLSSPDSMGLYLTWGAKRGFKDSQRNCISNIRPEGLNYDDACQRAMYLLLEARKLSLSGIHLKDRSVMSEESESHLDDKEKGNFLISPQ
ncbi:MULTISPECIES: ethanolamine ammonia-lyase subunit EutC [unclassified Vibrio]|uniref:Ethanolamine ammonia-lyase small subunit n=1 Tax=Vibrio sp. HB236076 TaxID=3232307 RepID=A0AB39HIU8_9VIBR|nr:ethanolamine ammonia-lyase subunit EutC [Vibrio sp. HB161653]MDP5254679.1 ethanolamine ammonia-lyase subunit EutC [Vibrio sp. HB161653]